MAQTNRPLQRVVFLTHEEPFFVPSLCRALLEQIPQHLVAVGFITPVSSWKQFRREYLNRLKYYGPVDFVRIAALYLVKRLIQPPIRSFFADRNIPIVTLPSSDLRDARVRNTLQQLQPDILLILGNQIVPRELLAIAKDGCFNIHVSLLPRHRGREPVFHALLAGDKHLGVTVHKMTPELDAGDIYAQASLIIEKGMTVLGTSKQLWQLGATLFSQMVLGGETRTQNPMHQDESKANYNRSFPEKEAVKRFRRQGWRFL